MDGVPGVSFPGIDPGETFTYEFPLIQSGTYWYHSHSGMQEAMGLYGPIVIDPAGRRSGAPMIASTCSSWRTGARCIRTSSCGSSSWRAAISTGASRPWHGLLAGKDQSLKDRLEWARMRMDPTDISDVTGATYSYLINGHGTAENWTGLFAPGERVRLRIINASSMTNFNLRIPGLAMTVVAADGLDVQPVETDEFQIAIAETYDVIVTPTGDAALWHDRRGDRPLGAGARDAGAAAWA